MRAPIVILALGLTLAGCVSLQEVEPATTTVDPVVQALLAEVQGLPCEGDVGAGTSGNLKELATLPLDAHGYATAAELWIQGDRAYVARYGTGGFNVVDISDPLNPVELAAWDPEEPDRGLDVKATTDGTAVLMGGDTGIRIVDVRDPAHLVLEHDHKFEKAQAHMLTVFNVDGQDYVAASKGDGMDLPIYRIAGEPGAHTLELASSPAITPTSRATGEWNPEDLTRTHDAFFHFDPVLEKPLLWAANPWDGIVALDVSDPENPEIIAHIPNVKPQYTHTVQTVVLDDMRRITISVSEVGYNTMKVFDTTDLDAPQQLAEWNVPVAAQPQHNLQVVPPFVYVAHYKEGTLVFELGDLLAGTVEPVGRIAATDASPEADSPTVMVIGASGLFDGTWDVGLKDGVVYTTSGGLNVHAFGCITPGDKTQTSAG